MAKPKDKRVTEHIEDTETGDVVVPSNATLDDIYEENLRAVLDKEADQRLPFYPDLQGISDDQQRFILAEVLRGVDPNVAAKKMGLTAEHFLRSRAHTLWDSTIEVFRNQAIARLQRALYLEGAGEAATVTTETYYEKRGGEWVELKKKEKKTPKPPNLRSAEKWLESQKVDGFSSESSGPAVFNITLKGVGGKTNDDEKALVQQMRDKAKQSIAYIVANEEADD